MGKRVLATILLLISVLYFPYWLSLILALAMMFGFPLFFEAVALFLISDLLFGVREPKLFNIEYAMFLFSVFGILGIELLKRRLRFYS